MGGAATYVRQSSAAAALVVEPIASPDEGLNFTLFRVVTLEIQQPSAGFVSEISRPNVVKITHARINVEHASDILCT